MTGRNPHTVRCDDELWSEFTNWVEEKEGQKHGEIGRHVENALEEYINADRGHRLEENQKVMREQLDEVLRTLSDGEGTHTHKTEPGCAGRDRVAEIHEQIVNNHDGALKDEQLERVIIDVADLRVGDPRTLGRYKDKLRRRGLLFEHPGDPPLWTEDTDLWGRWATTNATSKTDLEATCDGYPAQVYQNGSGLQIEIHKEDAGE